MKRYIMMALAIHCTIGCSDPAQEINEADSRMAVPVPLTPNRWTWGRTNITENREECDGLDTMKMAKSTNPAVAVSTKQPVMVVHRNAQWVCAATAFWFVTN